MEESVQKTETEGVNETPETPITKSEERVKEKELRLHITTQGQELLGINSAEYVIQTPYVGSELNHDLRITMKNGFCQVVRFVEGLGIRHCWFEDECPDCYTLLVNNQCTNQNCVQNME